MPLNNTPSIWGHKCPPEEQQAALMLHRTRDLLVRQRTLLINALRAHLGEYGIVKAQGPAGMTALLELVREA